MGVVVLFWQVSAAWSQDSGVPPRGDDEDGPALVAAREAQLGLVRVDNGDGTWSYAGPETPPADRQFGALTIRYDGQQRFPDVPTPNVGQVTYVEPEYVLTGLEYDPVGYLDLRFVDPSGQRWVVADFDVDALDPVGTSEAEATFWDSGSTPGIEWNPDAGDTHLMQLTSSTVTNCGTGETGFVTNDQNGPMTPQLNPLSATEALTVRVASWTGFEWVRCSGVLIRDDAVLTAAHCVTDSTGQTLPITATHVCTMENLDVNIADGKGPGCYDIVYPGAAVPSGWTGYSPYHIEHDWAVVFLERGTGLGAMPITSQSNTAVAALDDHHEGYPYWNPPDASSNPPWTCSFNASSDDCLRTDNRYTARELYTAIGDVRNLSGAFGKWNTSFAPQTSGGPHYLCAGGNCGTPELTGVQAVGGLECDSTGCSVEYAAGPKAIAFKTAVEAILAGQDAPTPCPAFGLEETDFTTNRPGDPTLIDPTAFSPTCYDDGNPATPLPPGFGTAICEKTVVYEPPAMHPDGCTAQDKLVVYMPGSGTRPEYNDYPLEYAAYAGYRTIGLSYANAWEIADWCDARYRVQVPELDDVKVCYAADGGDGVLDFTDECAYWLRQERITGVDDPRSTFNTAWTNWGLVPPQDQEGFIYLDNFPEEDSVLYRLLYTLNWLHAEDLQDAVNDCEWDDFFNDDDGNLQYTEGGISGFTGQMHAIEWEKVIVAGWSQGSGHAVWLALHEQVGGLFMLDGPSDMCLGTKTAAILSDPRGASYYTDLVDPVLEPSGAAPRFGVYHVSGTPPDGADPLDHPNRPVAWNNLFAPDPHTDPVRGLRMLTCDDQSWDGEVDAVEGSGTSGVPWLKRSPFPAIGSTIVPFTELGLETDQALVGCGTHESVAVSSRYPGPGPDCMPDLSASPDAPAATPEAAHLFEAYVQGFCALGQE